VAPTWRWAPGWWSSTAVLRAQALIGALTSTGRLEGQLRIPNTVGPITITADLRAGKVEISTEVQAPREGRSQTRVNWMVRQLKEAPEGLRVDCFAMHSRGASASELLREVRANPSLLCDGQNRELRSFRLTMLGSMGTKRGEGRGSFVSSILDPLDGFYASVVQHLKIWSAPPPKLRPAELPEPETEVKPALVSTSLSSQDGEDTAIHHQASSEPNSTPTAAPEQVPVQE
jgi:hypothetical protein